MNALKSLQIFCVGTHTDSSGRTLTFSDAEVAATAAAYDPTKHEAPLVVGHPATNAPAYGWADTLAYRQPALEATSKQVDPAFAEMVNAGRFKKISASFWLKDAPGNPVPGVYYLRHIGFLGAAAPAVKGLRDAAFHADADPDHTITLDFSLPQEPVMAETTDLAAREAAIAAREAAIAKTEADLATREAALASERAAQQRATDAAFADTLVQDGRLLPRDKSALVEVLSQLPTAQPLEFAEGDQTIKTTLRDWLSDFLKRLPPQVDYSERTPGPATATTAAPPIPLDRPMDYAVDSAGLALHHRALAYQAAHKVDYVTAVQTVQKVAP